MQNIDKQKALKEALILKEALVSASGLLEIEHKDIARIIGVSPSTISRTFSEPQKGIDKQSKEGELAILFLRAFRALDAFLGNSINNEKKWLRSYNKAIRGIPLEEMKNVSGLVRVVNYLDAIRGKI